VRRDEIRHQHAHSEHDCCVQGDCDGGRRDCRLSEQKHGDRQSDKCRVAVSGRHSDDIRVGRIAAQQALGDESECVDAERTTEQCGDHARLRQVARVHDGNGPEGEHRQSEHQHETVQHLERMLSEQVGAADDIAKQDQRKYRHQGKENLRAHSGSGDGVQISEAFRHGLESVDCEWRLLLDIEMSYPRTSSCRQ